MCCVPGAHISDVSETLPSLVQSTDSYLPPLFHVGSGDTAGSSPRSIKKDKDKELAGHGQWLNVQVEISDGWQSSGVGIGTGTV